MNLNLIISNLRSIFSSVCDFKKECESLKKFLQDNSPESEVKCHIGRRGSFEVKINDTLVHSKLQTLAFPEFTDVAENVRKAKDGEELIPVKQQKITDCCIS
jgi:selenoprotein W-related protein